MYSGDLGDYVGSIPHVKMDAIAFSTFLERLRRDGLTVTQIALDRWEVRRFGCVACMMTTFEALDGLEIDFYLMPWDTVVHTQGVEELDGSVTLEELPNVWPTLVYSVIRDGLLELGVLDKRAAEDANRKRKEGHIRLDHDRLIHRSRVACEEEKTMPTAKPEGASPLPIDPDNPPIAAIRELLTASFTPQTLRRFCLDRPAFRPVVDNFGPGHGLADMVDKVIEYCETMLVWDGLLAGVKEISPRRYERFVSGLSQRGRPSGAAPPDAPSGTTGPIGAGSVFDQQGQTVGTQINIAGDVYGPLPGIPTPDAPPPAADRAALRARLQRLDAVEIESLCLDHFPAVYDKFGRGQRRDEMINLLLDHCRRNPEEGARLAALVK